ncbi:MAG: carboxypeptidase-like regulatory domain-containing protein, partial [Miltoncostaeaceae bacterium]
MRPRTLIASTLAAVTLAVLVPSLATAFFCGGHGVCLDPIDVVVNVTAGANDPVSGATVVARDDRTGRVVSSTTTTGDLGYTVIRLRPGASAQRITITATGGRSQVVGGLSGADVMSATAQRGAIAAEIDVNVNPGSTVLAEYLDVRPGVSIAAAERAVARRLRLPAGTDVAESARFSRLRFSGADFITAARERGGVQAYADWTADRIGNGAGVRSFAAPRPVDDLPLRGDALGASRGASPRRENNVAASIAITVLKPFIEAGSQKIFCYLGIKFLCRSTPTPTPASGLTAAEKKQL